MNEDTPALKPKKEAVDKTAKGGVVNLLHPDGKHVVHITNDNKHRFLAKGYTEIGKQGK